MGFISTGYAERVRCAIMFNVDCFIVASYIPTTDLNNGGRQTKGCPSPPTASLVTINIPLLGGGVGDPISPASNAAASASTASAQARVAAGLNWQQQQPQ